MERKEAVGTLKHRHVAKLLYKLGKVGLHAQTESEPHLKLTLRHIWLAIVTFDVD